jgi:hypothetical protein
MTSRVVNTPPSNPTVATAPVPPTTPSPPVKAVQPAEVPQPTKPIATTTPSLPTIRLALKPLSIATEPWTSFGNFDTRIFKDDFCHENYFTAKLRATSVDGATINLKETVTLEKENTLKIKDELKLWFPIHYGKQHLHLRVRDTNTRIHYDNDLTEVGGQNFNFYTSFGWGRDFKTYNFKIGAATTSKKFNTDSRLSVNYDRNFALYHKTLVRSNDVRFGFIGVLDLTKQLLLKKDFLLGYTHQKWDFTFKAEQHFKRPTDDFSNPKQWFSTLSLTSTYTHDAKQKISVLV